MRGRSMQSNIMIVLLCIFLGPSLYAQVDETPLAQQYVEAALQAIQNGRWQDAEALLEQGSDFSAASSDLSYLLALVHFQLDRPIRSVLEALRQAKMTDRWQRYTDEAASLLETQALMHMRQFEQAQQILSRLFPSADVLYFRLKILALQNEQRQFTQLFSKVIYTYPLDPRFAELYFGYMKNKAPGPQDLPLISLLLSRLPALQKIDPILPVMAIPFIQDVSERRRIYESYRALGKDLFPILGLGLELGVLDEITAINELVNNNIIPVELARQVWGQLRTDKSRQYFSDALAQFSGYMSEDSDGDGISEALVEYQNGSIKGYRFDANQDKQDEIQVVFEQGIPKEGTIAPYEGTLNARVLWDVYPLVEQITAGPNTYIPAPAGFNYAPFKLKPLVGTYPDMPVLFPEREPFLPRITERALVSFAAKIIRPGNLAKDSIETIELHKGLPLRSIETLKGRIISVLEFSLGQPSIQHIDMDLDGRLETVRRFRIGTVNLDPVEALDYQQSYYSIESDWDGNGIFE